MRPRRVSVFGHVARLDDVTPANMALQLHINVSLTQPTSRPHVASPTWSSTEQLARPATKRFHPSSDWRAVEACCRPWTWWCNDATALAGYANLMMMASRTAPRSRAPTGFFPGGHRRRKGSVVGGHHGECGARAYNGGLAAEPPAGSGGRASGQG